MLDIIKWRKLDNSAKLFPIISSRNFSSVFRLSVILKENIKVAVLKNALNIVLESSFSSFKVRLRRGFFWYYLETNSAIPIIEEEHSYPCKYIDKNTNNNYLFKVTYFKNKINIDVFHSLTDGDGAATFLKEIVYVYIDLINNQKNEMLDLKHDNIYSINTEDSYLKNYDRSLDWKPSSKRAYILKGRKLPLYAIGAIHGSMDTYKLKLVCKESNATITEYFTALLIYSIYMGNAINNFSNKPIKICIPVNMKKYFISNTISNFFSYITVETNIDKENLKDFEYILDFVKDDFNNKLNKEELSKTMAHNIKLGSNLFIRLVPLFIKKITTKMSYLEIRRYTTTTLSNIGKIDVIESYVEYIDKFLLLLAPEKGEKIKCSVCSFKDSISFTFTSILEDTSIFKYFFSHLASKGIDINIESNGVYNEKM